MKKETEERRKSDKALEAKYQSLTIKNDFIFGKVMEDLEICREILSRIIGAEVDKLIGVEIQVTLKENIGARGVRLDSFVESENTDRFNTEMQNKPINNIGTRSRSYQVNTDIKILKPSQDFDDMPMLYIIFICTFDAMKDGRYLHEFVSTSKQNKELYLNDKIQKVIINTKGTHGDISQELKELIDYIEHGIIKGDFIKKIHEKVEEIKLNGEHRGEYMKYEYDMLELERKSRKEGIEIGEARGIELGEERGIELGEENERRKNIILTAKILRNIGVSEEDIIKNIMGEYTLSDEEIKEILKV